MEHNLTKARQLVKESGYDGRPVVVLHVTDIPFLNAAAIVTRQRLELIGFKYPQGDGLVDASDRAGAQGTAREGWLESTSYVVAGG